MYGEWTSIAHSIHLPYRTYNFQIDGLWSLTPKIGPLTDFGLLFPVVCFVSVSGQAL